MKRNPVSKRVRLPLRIAQELKREARRRMCSVSQIVARAISRDLNPRVAIAVTSSAGPLLERKPGILGELLARRLRERDFVTSEFPDPKAEYRVSISIEDFQRELVPQSDPDISRLRVNATLRVDYQLVDIGSGAKLAGRTLAVCRVTPPIIGGTSVGSDVIDQMLDDAAREIVEEFVALPLAR